MVLNKAHGWSSARSSVLLTAATLLCLLPFSGRAFHIDDPLFLWSAQQITKQPLNPYGFEVNWYGMLMPMSDVTKNPPLTCYYAAAIGAMAGWSERALHLGFLLPAIAMVLGTYRLAQHFTQSPLVAAAATLLTPGVLVSACSLMCDTMMLAFWLWAIIFWLEGLKLNKQRHLLASSLLVAAAALTKYFGICLVPLLLAYSVAERRRLGAWAWYFAVPVSLLAAYQFWTAALYGRGLAWDAFTYAGMYRLQAAGGFRSAVVSASFVGGCAFSVLAVVLLVWPRKRVLSAILIAILIIGAYWAILARRTMLTGMATQEHWITITVQAALFITCGVSVLALAAIDLWTHRNADSLLLALWVFGTFTFTAFLNWTVNARSVLPLIPAAGILLARRLDMLGIYRLRPLRWKVAAALLFSGAISFWIAQADADLANSAKQMANTLADRTKGEAGRVWFQGHWGFQYYMQQRRIPEFDFGTSELGPGDLLVIYKSDQNTLAPPRRFVLSAEQVEIRLRQPVAIMYPDMKAGFYASVYGVLPFAFGAITSQRFEILRMATTVGAECRPSDNNGISSGCFWTSN